MSQVSVTTLGWVCVNPENQTDVRVFTSLELLEKTIPHQELPIIDTERLSKKGEVFPYEIGGNNWRTTPENAAKRSKQADETLKPSTVGYINWDCKPVQTFLQNALGLIAYENDKIRRAHPFTISTSGKVMKQFLAFCEPKATENQEMPFGTRYSDYNLVNQAVGDFNLLVVSHCTPNLQTNYTNYGRDVENYLTRREKGKKCYQMFSIHVLAHTGSNAHFIYATQIDGFFDENQNLIPAEIKCVKTTTTATKPTRILQAILGQNKHIVHAHYHNNVSHGRMEYGKWNVHSFERESVPEVLLPYETDRILLLSKFLEHNKNIPSLMRVVENVKGNNPKIQVWGSIFNGKEVAMNCVLGKCAHCKSSRNECETLDDWFANIGDGNRTTKTTFS